MISNINAKMTFVSNDLKPIGFTITPPVRACSHNSYANEGDWRFKTVILSDPPKIIFLNEKMNRLHLRSLLSKFFWNGNRNKEIAHNMKNSFSNDLNFDENHHY